MKYNRFSVWCSIAVGKILFPPDRRMVEKELIAHLVDHRDALVAQGMDEETATELALEAMGSAEEIAPQLAALHKPFWGYVEAITRTIAIVLSVLALFTGLIWVSSFHFPWQTNAERDNFSIMGQERSPSIDQQTDVSATMEPYTYTVTRVAVYPFQVDYSECLIRLDVAGGSPFSDSHAPLSNFWATDSLGNLYYSEEKKDELYAIQMLSRICYWYNWAYAEEIANITVRLYDASGKLLTEQKQILRSDIAIAHNWE